MFEGMTHTTWDDAAASAVEGIFDLALSSKTTKIDGLLADLRTKFDDFVDQKFDSPDDGNDSAIIICWATLGALSIEIASARKKSLSVGQVTSTLIRKQRDYGHENIRRFGRQGLLVRCHDKVARLENLLSSNTKPSNESIEDTLLDIVGYSAIGIMWERSEFLLDLSEEIQ